MKQIKEYKRLTRTIEGKWILENVHATAYEKWIEPFECIIINMGNYWNVMEKYSSMWIIGGYSQNFRTRKSVIELALERIHEQTHEHLMTVQKLVDEKRIQLRNVPLSTPFSINDYLTEQDRALIEAL